MHSHRFVCWCINNKFDRYAMRDTRANFYNSNHKSVQSWSLNNVNTLSLFVCNIFDESKQFLWTLVYLIIIYKLFIVIVIVICLLLLVVIKTKYLQRVYIVFSTKQFFYISPIISPEFERVHNKALFLI